MNNQITTQSLNSKTLDNLGNLSGLALIALGLFMVIFTSLDWPSNSWLFFILFLFFFLSGLGVIWLGSMWLFDVLRAQPEIQRQILHLRADGRVSQATLTSRWTEVNGSDEQRTESKYISFVFDAQLMDGTIQPVYIKDPDLAQYAHLAEGAKIAVRYWAVRPAECYLEL